MGTRQQKDELVSKVLGVSANTVKEVFSTSARNIPCVYLFILGTVKDLKKTMKINKKYKKDYVVCKYGFTKDLPRRTGEHMKIYGKIKNADLKLKYYSYIVPLYISKAETDICDFFGASENQHISNCFFFVIHSLTY